MASSKSVHIECRAPRTERRGSSIECKGIGCQTSNAEYRVPNTERAARSGRDSAWARGRVFAGPRECGSSHWGGPSKEPGVMPRLHDGHRGDHRRRTMVLAMRTGVRESAKLRSGGADEQSVGAHGLRGPQHGERNRSCGRSHRARARPPRRPLAMRHRKDGPLRRTRRSTCRSRAASPAGPTSRREHRGNCGTI